MKLRAYSHNCRCGRYDLVWKWSPIFSGFSVFPNHRGHPHLGAFPEQYLPKVRSRQMEPSQAELKPIAQGDTVAGQLMKGVRAAVDSIIIIAVGRGFRIASNHHH